MEERAGVRELKGRLSSYLRWVKEDGTVLATERGQPVARIVPVSDPPEARLAVLRRAGVLAWNGQPHGVFDREACARQAGRRGLNEPDQMLRLRLCLAFR